MHPISSHTLSYQTASTLHHHQPPVCDMFASCQAFPETSRSPKLPGFASLQDSPTSPSLSKPSTFYSLSTPTTLTPATTSNHAHIFLIPNPQILQPAHSANHNKTKTIPLSQCRPFPNSPFVPRTLESRHLPPRPLPFPHVPFPRLPKHLSEYTTVSEALL